MRVNTERRRWPRHEPATDRVDLEWWDGCEAQQGVGRVRDVSWGGLRLEADAEVSVGRTLWLSLEGGDWATGRVVRRDGGGMAVRFPEGCPGDLFYGLTQGIRLDGLLASRDDADSVLRDGEIRRLGSR